MKINITERGGVMLLKEYKKLKRIQTQSFSF